MAFYLLTSSICLSLSYLIYFIFFRNEQNFKHTRYFLLGTVILSVIIPLTNLGLDLGIKNSLGLNKPLFNFTISAIDRELVNQPLQAVSTTDHIGAYIKTNWFKLIQIIYLVISFILLTKVIAYIVRLIFTITKSKKYKSGNFTIVYSKKSVNTSSFFKWIFINPDTGNNTDMDKIIVHEKIHASQYHSIDRILIELLSAVMWFNPFIWKMKNSFELVHEYLADEGVLGTGIDRLKYQALLLNHVTEEKLICVSSSFNHSLIKKRMLMISKRNLNQKTKLKVFVLIPVAVAMFFGVAFVNAQNNPENALIDIPEESQGQSGVDNNSQLKFGEISWTGNVIFTTKELIDAFEFKTGDRYDSLKIQKYLSDSGYGVPGLYLNNGYAFCDIKYKETLIGKNIIDLDITIKEGVRCKFGKITIKGNKKITDDEIFKRIKVKSGDWFTARGIVKSIEAIQAMNKFDPEKVIPDVILDNKKSTETLGIFNIEFQVTEI